MIKKTLAFLNRQDGSVRQKTIRASTWVALSSLLIFFLTFVRTIILARLLEPEAFGLAGICMMIVGLVETFSRPGFVAALIHRQDEFEVARDTAFVLLVMRGIILSILIAAFAPAVAWFYDEQLLTGLIATISLYFVINGFSNINTVAYQKAIDFKVLSYLDLLRGAISTVFIIALAYILEDVWALVLGYVITALVGVILSYVMISGRPTFSFDRKIAKELFYYGKYIVGLGIFVFLTQEIDKAVIGKVLGVELLGYYVIAYMLGNLTATHFTKVISKTLFPAYSQLQNDYDKLSRTFSDVFKIVAMFAVPATAGLIVLADDIILVLYGEKWLPATVPVQILAAFGCLRAVSGIAGYLYNGIGKPSIPFYLVAGKFVAIALIIYPMTLWYGLAGAAMAVTIPAVAEFFVGLYMLERILRISVWGRMLDLAKPVALSIVMALILVYAKLQLGDVNALELVMLVIFGASIYVIIGIRDVRWCYRRIMGKPDR